MISMNRTKKLFGNVLDMLPFPRRSRSILDSPIVLGAIGVAVLGGIAAVMVFSPRTRYRVLGAAKDTYGKVAGSSIGAKLGMMHPRDVGATAQPNGLGSSSYGVPSGI